MKSKININAKSIKNFVIEYFFYLLFALVIMVLLIGYLNRQHIYNFASYIRGVTGLNALDGYVFVDYSHERNTSVYGSSDTPVIDPQDNSVTIDAQASDDVVIAEEFTDDEIIKSEDSQYDIAEQDIEAYNYSLEIDTMLSEDGLYIPDVSDDELGGLQDSDID